MGWSSGTGVMDAIIKAVQPNVPDEAVRQAIYRPIIEALNEQDWDTQNECMGEDPAFDAALIEVDPMYGEDDEEDF